MSPDRDTRIRAIRALPAEAQVPVGFFVDLLPADDAAEALTGPPHPDGWATRAIAERYRWSPSKARKKIADGEFGDPEAEDGPKQRDGTWWVPHHQVLARDARVQGAAVYDARGEDGSGTGRFAFTPAVDLVEARRRMKGRGGA